MSSHLLKAIDFHTRARRVRRMRAATVIAFALVVHTAAAEALDFPVAYVRCERTTEPFTVDGVQYRYGDVADTLPDVVNFFGDFNAPCDLMLLEPGGKERVLYDCSSRSSDASACAALDPAVSFDGKKIAFSVFEGSLEHPSAIIDKSKVDLPTRYLRSTHAQLHIVDVQTGEDRAIPQPPGVYDSGPAWLSNGRIAFTSTRANQFRTLVSVAGNMSGPHERITQIHTMDPDGRNVTRVSEHSLSGDQHPLQLRDGRVAFSSWQLFGALPFRKDNGTPGGFGTIPNMFHIYTQHPDGAAMSALYGQHIQDKSRKGPSHKAAHFLGQSTDGRVWTTDYYRRNNNGLGLVVGFTPLQGEQEGFGPDEHPDPKDIYRPRDSELLAEWANNGDVIAKAMPGGPMRVPEYADPLQRKGKIGHPSGAPGNRLLLTWGKGIAFNLQGKPAGRRIEALMKDGLDIPANDAGVYITSRIPSRHPSDLVRVVDSRKWHEFMARAVVPYREIFGVDTPAVLSPAYSATRESPALSAGTPFGLLGAASITYRETRSVKGHPFMGKFQWALQGTDTADYSDDELCGIRILVVQPNQNGDEDRMTVPAGERVAVLGEFPVRNYSGGKPVLDARGLPDTSFLVRFPANTPYLMQGIDCEGRTLNTDQTWQDLKPGEKKVCGGCHVHGKPGMDFDKTYAARDDYPVVKLGEGVVPLLDGGAGASVKREQVAGWGRTYEFQRDVFPILQRRCASCHGGSAPAAGLALDRPGTDPGSTYFCLVRDRTQECVPPQRQYRTDNARKPTWLERPQLTRYLRFMNARGSLLYWKAANRRLDGRTDAQYGPQSGPEWNDIDFGPDHPTDITPQELGILSRWIDTGTASGAGVYADTTPPALNVAAITDGKSLKGLRIGTADATSGIDVRSLEVCVLNNQGACAESAGPMAEPAGITTAMLSSPITNPDTEIRCRVKDRAGNQTELRWTVGWLLERSERR